MDGTKSGPPCSASPSDQDHGPAGPSGPWGRNGIEVYEASGVTILNRLSTGQWNVPGPATMNSEAAALGPQYNIFSVNGQIVPAAPSFISYMPAPYLRPFDLP